MRCGMTLNNLLFIGGDQPINIQVSGTKIKGVSQEAVPCGAGSLQLSFDQALVFPGLINSHDHLDFNLFPPLGDRIYNNYTEWGKHIHETYKNKISDVLQVPGVLREQWGIFKNLICGVTTVVNHGGELILKERLITVHEQYYCLHSVKFEKKWKRKLNNPLKLRDPVVIHTGEGTDPAAALEIDQLIRWNLLGKELIGVHGVAMSKEQAKRFRALVWCPESNYFLLNKTAAINDLKAETEILFGTDSTLTGNWNIWDHLRLARRTAALSDAELYKTLNENPSRIWKIQNEAIKPGYNADLVIAGTRDRQSNLDAFFSIGPKDILLVMHQGNIRLFDASLIGQLRKMDLSGFSKINVEGVCKYVEGDVPGLMETIKRYYPEVIFPLAAEQN
jgi:cytosine/adenosine deaminase-related metal-dependent hydrolase